MQLIILTSLTADIFLRKSFQHLRSKYRILTTYTFSLRKSYYILRNSKKTRKSYIPSATQ